MKVSRSKKSKRGGKKSNKSKSQVVPRTRCPTPAPSSNVDNHQTLPPTTTPPTTTPTVLSTDKPTISKAPPQNEGQEFIVSLLRNAGGSGLIPQLHLAAAAGVAKLTVMI